MRRYDGYLHRRVEPGRPVIRLTSQSSGVEKVMADSLVDNYKSQHQHPLNNLCHRIGIPLIIFSAPLFFFRWRWALALFVAGWVLQFIGHAIEGNQPAFFRHPVYFFIGPWCLCGGSQWQLVFTSLLRQNSGPLPDAQCD